MRTTRLLGAAAIVAGVMLGPLVHAQDRSAVVAPAAQAPNGRPQDVVVDHPAVARALSLLEALHDRGIYPDAGTIVSGSGLAFGSGFRSPTWGRTGISFEVDAMWSIRDYRTVGLQVGLLTRRRRTLALRPADAEIGRAFDLPSPGPGGLAVYLDGRYRIYRQMAYYGLDAQAPEGRADYSLSGYSADLVAQWQHSPMVAVSGRLGVLDLDLGPGHGDRPDVAAVFDEGTAPGLSDRPRYRVSGIGVVYDGRDRAQAPTNGLLLGISVRHFSALSGASTSLTRLTLDGRLFRSLASGQVLAVNVLASADRTPGSAPPPFYLQSWLGGSRTLRGLSSYRWRGETLAHVAIEYRWRIARFVEVAPLLDLGAVSASGEDIRDAPLHTSMGAGVRLRSDDRVFVRLDWATTDGHHRVLLSLSPSF